jgi:hypothetical protein
MEHIALLRYSTVVKATVHQKISLKSPLGVADLSVAPVIFNFWINDFS